MSEPFKDQLKRVQMMGMDRNLESVDCAAINAVLHRYNRMIGALKGADDLLHNSVITRVIAEAEGSDVIL